MLINVFDFYRGLILDGRVFYYIDFFFEYGSGYYKLYIEFDDSV